MVLLPLKKFIFSCLLVVGSLLCATSGTDIPLTYGDFENVDTTLKKHTHGFGAFSFYRRGWNMAAPENVASGKGAVTVRDIMTITADIPRELRGHSLKLSFKGKGNCHFLINIREKQFDEKGKLLRHKSKEKKVYCNRDTRQTIYSSFTDFNIYCPPLSPQTMQVTFTLRQSKYDFHMDDVKLTAYKTPFYRQGQPVPLPDSLTSFETGPWKYANIAVTKALSPKTNQTTMFLSRNASMTLDLPAEHLRGKWLSLRLKTRGQGKLNIWLNSGATGVCNRTFCVPDKLPTSETVMQVWFYPVNPHAEEVKLIVESQGIAELSALKVFASPTPMFPHLAISDDDLKKTLPKDFLVGRNPEHPGLVNVAPCAEIITRQDLILRRRAMVDGALGASHNGPAEFRFKKPVRIAELRLTLPPSSLMIQADTSGDGDYDTLLATKEDGLRFSRAAKDLREYVWYRKVLPNPLQVHGIKYIPGGYAAGTYEFQILATPKDAAPLLAMQPSALPQAPLLTAGAPVIVPKPALKDRLFFGFTLETWMFDVPSVMKQFYAGKITAPPPIEQWKGWQKIIKDFKTLHANFILLFPPDAFMMPPGTKPRPGAAYPSPLLWKSDAWYVTQPLNILKILADSCRKNNIHLFPITREWLFKKGLKDGPVIMGKEIASQQAHGIPVGVDEQVIRIKCGQADNLKSRKILLESLEETASYMRKIKEVSRTINPASVTFGGFSMFYYFKDRLRGASPHDAWGFQGQTDIMGGDAAYFVMSSQPFGSYTPVIGIAEYASLAATRRVLATQNFNWWTHWNPHTQSYDWPLVYDDYPNVAITGGALSCYFNKAEYLDFWRYNFMDLKGGPPVRKAVARAGRMTEVLSAWGGKKARIPKDVLILRSRTSEDWWNLKQRELARKNPPRATAENPTAVISGEELTKKRRFQGSTQFNWCITQLIANAIPNEIYMMNQFNAWKDIAKNYKVIILPFPYAVSSHAAATLKAAARAGVRIIALEGCGYGPVDDLGEPHPQGPVLRKMVAEGTIQSFPLDILNTHSARNMEAEFRALLKQALNAKGGPTLRLQRQPDQDIQAYMLETSPREKLVLLVNYSEQNTAVNLGVNLPEGLYAMTICRQDDVVRGSIGGKQAFTADQLRNFQIRLPVEETLMLRITPRTP